MAINAQLWRAAAACAFACFGIVLWAGCNGGQHAAATSSASGKAAPSRTLASNRPGNAQPDWAADARPLDLDEILREPESSAPPPSSASQGAQASQPVQEPPVIGPDPRTYATSPDQQGNYIAVTVDPPVPSAPVKTVSRGGSEPAAEKTLEQRIGEASVSLIDLITQQAMTGQMGWRSYIALAALDVLRPEGGGGGVPVVITPRQGDGGPLSAEDRQAIESLRSFFKGLAEIPADVGPDARADRMAELADKLLETRPLRIRAAHLCSRVTGFGQFVPLTATRFQQGRPVRAIVYTEVARFGHRELSEGSRPREAGAGDRWAVELSQSIQVFHDADGVLAWSRPAETISETSRNKRRDFFLVHEITLPPTLTIGAYRLKVTMKDRVTGHEDQAIIPFEVVADAAAVSEAGRR